MQAPWKMWISLKTSSQGDWSVLVRRNTRAVSPPIFVDTTLDLTQNLTTFGRILNMLVLSCVSNTALPVFGLTSLARESKVSGYSFRLSALLPLLRPKGKSEMTTSTELSLRHPAFTTSHWITSTAGKELRLFFTTTPSRLARQLFTDLSTSSPARWKVEGNPSAPSSWEKILCHFQKGLGI